jgi:hypothetical protein
MIKCCSSSCHLFNHATHGLYLRVLAPVTVLLLTGRLFSTLLLIKLLGQHWALVPGWYNALGRLVVRDHNVKVATQPLTTRD